MISRKAEALGPAALAIIVPVLLISATGLLLAGLSPQPICCGIAAFAPGQEFDGEQAIAPWVAMWNSYDLSQVGKLFLASERVTYISSEKEGLIRGIDALREHHAGFGFVPGGKKQENKLWVDNLHAEDFGETAVVAGTWYFQRAKTPELIQRGPFSFVYVKTASGFRIAHGHFSNAPQPKSPD